MMHWVGRDSYYHTNNVTCAKFTRRLYLNVSAKRHSIEQRLYVPLRL